jgi:uncharacterized membrane protein
VTVPPLARLVLAYLGAAAVFLAVDLLWLGVVARDLYRRHLGGFLADDVNWAAALVFYLLFIVGIFIFAVVPAAERESARHAVVMGALFGFFTYATYELTNLALMEGWPLPIVFVDIAWGATLTGTTALAGYYFLRWMG